MNTILKRGFSGNTGKVGFVPICLMLLGAALFLVPTPALAGDAPNLVNYQAVVTDSGGTNINDALHDFRFTVMDATVAGNVVGGGPYTSTDVTVSNGLLNIQVALPGSDFTGSGTNEYYLKIEMGDGVSGADSTWEELTPRQRIVSVPFALEAKKVDGTATITGGTITGITDLAVADGGTGTSTGSITGTTALTLAAGGTNQNVILTPSGAGDTVLNGDVGIGTTSPLALLDVNGVSAAGLGTVSAPGFAFRTDLDTGIFSTAANFMSFATNATERIRITDGGKVGLGTAVDPTGGQLHITSGVDVGVYVLGTGTSFVADANAASGVFGHIRGDRQGAAKYYLGLNANSDFAVLNANASVAMTVMTSGNGGNVGIGTTVPGSSLDVWGELRIQDAAKSLLQIIPDSGKTIIRLNANSGNADLEIQEDGGQLVMFFDESTKRVGIGNTGPQSLLDIQGAPGAAGILTLASQETTVVDGDKLGQIDFNAPLESDGTDAILVGASIWAEADATFSTTVNSTELVFATGTSETAVERMRITSDGNVGIGTTSPDTGFGFGTNYRILDIRGSSADKKGLIILAAPSVTGSNETGLIGFGNATNGFYSRILGFRDGADDQIGLKLFGVTTGAVASGITIKHDGKVGIGTTAPATALHVIGKGIEANRDGNPVIFKLFRTDVVSDGTEVNTVQFHADDSGGADTLYGVIRARAEDVTDGTEDGSISFGTTRAGTITEAMRIDENGKVGIGTTAPSATLHTKGSLSTALSGTVATTNTSATLTGTTTAFDTELAVNDAIKVGSEIFTVSAIASATSLTLDSASTVTASGVTAYKDPNLFAVYTGDGVAKFVVDKTGNYGIGTTAPQSILDIQGEAGAPGILTLATKELTVVDGDKLGQINFNAPLESDGSDAILVGASIWAEADDTFSTTVNSTELVFATGTSEAAAEKMRIDRDGNVGIGTTGPTDVFHVLTSSSDTSIARFESTAANGGAGISLENDAQIWTLRIDGSDGDKFQIEDAGGQRLTIDTSGKVGIGTTSPSSPLHIFRASSGATPQTNSGLAVEGSGETHIDILTPNNVTAFLQFGDPEDNDAGRIGYQHGSQRMIFIVEGVTQSVWEDGELGFQKAMDITTTSGDITLNPAGDVGIGTTAPLKLLDVAGSAQVKGTATSVLTGTIDPAASTTVTGVSTLFTTELVVGDRITVTGETRTVTAIASNTSLTVDTAFTDNANDTTPDKLAAELIVKDSSNNIDFIVTDNGDVGIGTTTPGAYKLYVNGDTYLGGLTVSDGNLTFGGALDMGNNLITNIGHANTDFTTGGGLNVTGNVGIGTTSPDLMGWGSGAGKIVSILGTADKESVLELAVPSVTGTNSVGRIVFGNDAGVGIYSSIRGFRDGADNSIGLKLQTYDLGTTLNEITIKSNGNVGIGTTSPGTALEVTGTISVTNAAGGAIVDEVAGTTNPTLIPNKSNLTTGIGANNGNLELIRNGVRFIELDGSNVNFSNFNLVNAGNGGNDWTNTALTSAVPLQITSASDSYFTGNGNVGIGTTAPQEELHINGKAIIGGTTVPATDFQQRINNDGHAGIQLSAHGTSKSALLYGYSSAGTEASPTIVAADQQLMHLYALGYDGAAYRTAATIKFIVDGTPGASDMPGGITFSTTPDGTAGDLERMRIDDAGNVGIGTTNPSTLLYIQDDTPILTIEGETSTAAASIHLKDKDGRQLTIESPDLGGSPADIKAGDQGILFGTTSHAGALRIEGNNTIGHVNINGGGDMNKAVFQVRNFDQANSQIAVFSQNTTAVTSGEVLGGLSAWTSDDNITGHGERVGDLQFIATEAHSATAYGNALAFFTADNTTTTVDERMRIDHDGEVGIGTTAPSATLHTKGSLSTALAGTVATTNTSATLTGTTTAFDTALAVGDAIKVGAEIFTVSAIASATSLTLDSASTVTASGVTAYSDPNLFAIDTGDGVSKFVIDKTGNYGIGTTAPAAELEIAGDVILSGTPQLFINDTANANQTIGLTINQGANDDQSFALKSSDVAHGLINGSWLAAETDDYFSISKQGGPSGGVNLAGWKEDNTDPIVLRIMSAGGQADTDKTSTAQGLIQLDSIEHDGAGNITNITADGNLVVMRARVGGAYSARWILDEDGDTRQAGGAIFESGNVGIGTTVPDLKLHIFGDGSAGTVVANGNADLVIENNASTGVNFLSPNTTIQYIMFGDPENSAMARIYYDHNADLMGFFSSGADRMVIDSAGEVGIGTTAPQSLLDVQAAAGAAGILTLATKELTVVDGDKLGQINFNAPLESDGTDAILVGASIWAEADATFSTTVNSTELVFATGTSETATEKMRIDSAGNVGIDENSPFAPLTIGGSAPTTLGIGMIGIGGASSAPAAGDIFSIGIGFRNDASRKYPSEIGYVVNDATGGTVGDLFFATRNVTTVTTVPTERMRITQAGNVGIGTTAPGAMLDIEGTTALKITATETDSSTHAFEVNTDDSTANIKMYKAGVQNIQIVSEPTADTYFNAGDVGIGTTAPLAQFHTLESSATTNALVTTTLFDLESTGTAAAGLGHKILFRVDDAGGGISDVAQIEAFLTTATAGSEDGALAFSTSASGATPSERMRIDEAGNVGIGTTAPGAKLDVVGGDIHIDATESIYLDGGGNTFIHESAADTLALVVGGATKAIFGMTGVNMQEVYDNTTASAADVHVTSGGLLQRSTSSLRYKHDVQDYSLDRARAAIAGLRPITYRGKTDEDQREYLGFIAEEVAVVEPLLATYIDLDGKQAPDYVTYDRVAAPLVAVVQDLMTNENERDQRITVLADGNVGVGTTAPESALHVPDGKYAQFADNNAGAPAPGDCDSDTERGRMSIDTTNNRLYICNGATRGWDYVGLTD